VEVVAELVLEVVAEVVVIDDVVATD